MRPVLIHVRWMEYGNPKSYCYIMDQTVTAYPNEHEVIIQNGVQFKVLQVEEANIEGKSVVKITLEA